MAGNLMSIVRQGHLPQPKGPVGRGVRAVYRSGFVFLVCLLYLPYLAWPKGGATLILPLAFAAAAYGLKRFGEDRPEVLATIEEPWDDGDAKSGLLTYVFIILMMYLFLIEQVVALVVAFMR